MGLTLPTPTVFPTVGQIIFLKKRAQRNRRKPPNDFFQVDIASYYFYCFFSLSIFRFWFTYLFPVATESGSILKSNETGGGLRTFVCRLPPISLDFKVLLDSCCFLLLRMIMALHLDPFAALSPQAYPFPCPGSL